MEGVGRGRMDGGREEGRKGGREEGRKRKGEGRRSWRRIDA
jgi:hypothetical protein